MKSVAVFFGGKTVEHDISVITGVLTAHALDKEKYDVVPVYVNGKGLWFTGEQLLDLDEYKNLNENKLNRVTFVCGENVLYHVKGKKVTPKKSISVAINCIHGERGEDGCLAGLLKMCNVPVASPDVLSAAVSMDKRFTKIALKGIGVKTLPCKVVEDVDQTDKLADRLNYPVMVKPNALGSSIGITRVDAKTQLRRAVSTALRFGKTAIIEPCFENFIEINCAAYLRADGSVCVSECERPIGKEKFLSFKDKYVSGGRVFPADISKKNSNRIKKLTQKVYLALNFTGVIRIDFFIKGDNVYLNEINSVPGSLAYYLFGQTESNFSKILDQLISVAERNYATALTCATEYKSGILFGGGVKGGKTKGKIDD